MSEPLYKRALSAEEVLACAPALTALVSAAGWAEYRDLIERRQHMAAMQSAMGESNAHDYWQGFIHGLAAALEMPGAVDKAAAQVAKRESAESRVSSYRGTVRDRGDTSF